jgi:hypothetical protein
VVQVVSAGAGQLLTQALADLPGREVRLESELFSVNRGSVRVGEVLPERRRLA